MSGVPGYPEALRVLRRGAGADLHRILTAAGEPVPAWDPAEELLRRLVQTVLEHQAAELRDDATLLLVQWTGENG
jgi:serine phosphatase RsbU (regulator of sigma subunit)